MKMTFLGTGNAFAPRRDWSCLLVNDAILLDAGPGALVNLKRARVSPACVRHICISHFHGDHFFGVPFLLLEYAYATRTDEPLTILGPSGVEERIRAAAELAFPGLLTKRWPRPITFYEVQPSVTQTVDGLTITPIPVEHGGMEAYGYRLHLPDGLLAYSGDASLSDALYALIDGAQVIVTEADSGDTSTMHMGREALRVVVDHKPADSVLILTHLNTPGDESWADLPAYIAHDLDTFAIALHPGQPPRVTVTGGSY